MVNCYRIKEYTFPPTNVASSDYSAAGSKLTLYSHALNGEVLKLSWLSNFAGSLIVGPSGASVTQLYGNYTVASGTNKVESIPYSNTTGSYVLNGPLMLIISGTCSGTGVEFGAFSVMYR